MKKKRLPIEQLREAGKMANQMLIEKGIHTKESAIDAILRTDKSPILPGVPAYLPHIWTLKGAQQVMYDLLREWQFETKDRKERQEDIKEFFKFAIRRMREEESKANAEVVNMPKMLKMMKDVPVLKDVFSPLRKKSTIKSVNTFFVDSFAVAVIVKSNTCTSEYAEWFLKWTEDLYELWAKRDNQNDRPREAGRNIAVGGGDGKHV